MKLPDFDELNKPADELTKEEIKTRMKEMGVSPARSWIEKPMYISSTGAIFEPYVPPEGDGKVSVISTQVHFRLFQFVITHSYIMMLIIILPTKLYHN